MGSGTYILGVIENSVLIRDVPPSVRYHPSVNTNQTLGGGSLPAYSFVIKMPLRPSKYNRFCEILVPDHMNILEEETGLNVISSDRQYLLLEKITYPDNAFTRFEYKKGIPITNEAGGQIDHYQISMKEDCVGNDQYHRTEYSYGKGDAPNYKDDIGSEKKVIKAHSHTIVTKHQYIEETYWFDKEGLPTQKEIRHHGAPVLNSEYTYEKKLMVSAVDLAFNRNDTSKKLEKKMFWEYSTDNKANILVESEEYPEDHECDQEIIMKYGNYSIVTEITRKKGSDVI